MVDETTICPFCHEKGIDVHHVANCDAVPLWWRRVAKEDKK